MHDSEMFECHRVPNIDIKGIFERAAGHPARIENRTIVCGDAPADLMETNNGRTLSGKLKPGSFAITPTRRTEQFFA